MTVFLFLSSSSIPSFSAERLEFQPGGVVLYGARSYSGAVMSAYQKAYAMNFEIWKPQDLPAGWYATFDGFPVAQIAENRWVYGQIGLDGAIMPTNILVGSVVPSRVPGITRIAAVWSWGKSINSPKFRWIRTVNINRLGWLNTEYVNTIIAWQMIKRLSPWIAAELRKHNVWLDGGEPIEVADLTRQWGFIWGGRVILESLKTYGYDSGRDSNETTTSFSENSSSGNGNNDSPQEDDNNDNGGQWDVD